MQQNLPQEPSAVAAKPRERPADPVVASAPLKKTRVSRLREAGESMFGKAWSGK